MNIHRDNVKAQIRSKVVQLARNLDRDATGLTDEAIIPASGLLDSVAILELVVWLESEFDLPLSTDDITVDNLGSLNRMTNFVIARKSA